MRRKSRIVVGTERTWAVSDLRLDGDLEVKYTVDASGTELLLYRDSTAPHLLARDRWAIRRSRLTALLPLRLRRAIAHRRRHKPRLRSVIRERLHHAYSTTNRMRRANLVTVGPAHRPHLAARVTSHDSATESNHQREQVLHALRTAGIEAAVLPGGRGKRAVVVIRETDQQRAHTALTRTLGRPWYVVPLDEPGARPRPLTERRLRRLTALSDGYRVFRYVAAAPDRVIAGAMLGCDIEIWRTPQPAPLEKPGPAPDLAGRLIAPRRNAWTSQLGPDTWHDAGSRPGHIVDTGKHPHIFDVNGPIDIVYTWVDDTDPAWNARKHKAQSQAQDAPLAPEADSDARYRTHDELRYSLRSIEMYAPWVRRIHIVTDQQKPDWLNTDHPKINLVDHRDIFTDPSVLPVFNSHAIESQLHHIPGLAERYIYLNDDVFIGRPVAKDLFFHGNGLAKFYLSTAKIGLGPRQPHEPAFVQAAKNNRVLLADRFERSISSLFQHAPQPQLRSVLEQLESEHPDEFARVAATRFRSSDDLSIASSLHHYYAYSLGRAVPGRLEYLYLDLGHPAAARRLERLIRSRNYDVYCINDTPHAGSRDTGPALALTRFLERYYPLKSSYEL